MSPKQGRPAGYVMSAESKAKTSASMKHQRATLPSWGAAAPRQLKGQELAMAQDLEQKPTRPIIKQLYRIVLVGDHYRRWLDHDHEMRWSKDLYSAFTNDQHQRYRLPLKGGWEGFRGNINPDGSAANWQKFVMFKEKPL